MQSVQAPVVSRMLSLTFGSYHLHHRAIVIVIIVVCNPPSPCVSASADDEMAENHTSLFNTLLFSDFSGSLCFDDFSWPAEWRDDYPAVPAANTAEDRHRKPGSSASPNSSLLNGEPKINGNEQLDYESHLFPPCFDIFSVLNNIILSDSAVSSHDITNRTKKSESVFETINALTLINVFNVVLCFLNQFRIFYFFLYIYIQSG